LKQNFEKEKLAAIMGIVYRTAEPEWKDARAAQGRAWPNVPAAASMVRLSSLRTRMLIRASLGLAVIV